MAEEVVGDRVPDLGQWRGEELQHPGQSLRLPPPREQGTPGILHPDTWRPRSSQDTVEVSSNEVYQKILLILIKQFSSVMKYVDWSGTIIGESYFLFMDFKTFLTARI